MMTSRSKNDPDTAVPKSTCTPPAYEELDIVEGNGKAMQATPGESNYTKLKVEKGRALFTSRGAMCGCIVALTGFLLVVFIVLCIVVAFRFGSHVKPEAQSKFESETVKYLDAIQADLTKLRNHLAMAETNSTSILNQIRTQLRACKSAIHTPFTDVCYVGDGRNYAGLKSVTGTGKTCQEWSARTPHKPNELAKDLNNFPDATFEEAANYCRNPDFSVAGVEPWCYTTDPLVRWEYCGIPKC